MKKQRRAKLSGSMLKYVLTAGMQNLLSVETAALVHIHIYSGGVLKCFAKWWETSNAAWIGTCRALLNFYLSSTSGFFIQLLINMGLTHCLALAINSAASLSIILINQIILLTMR